MIMLLKGGKILNENFCIENKDIYIEKGKISFCGQNTDVIDITGLIVIPGLIDMHIHGYGGINITDAHPEELRKISDELIKTGTTSFLATTTTMSEEHLKNAVRNIGIVMSEDVLGAEIAGIYMEGPFISKKYKGAMREDYIRTFSESELNEYIEYSGGNIKIITLAPEVKENFEGIKVAVSKGIITSVGHTNATAKEIDSSIEEGISNATHLFNAMRGINHREPGVVGAVLDSNITAELICDGHHVDEKVIRMAYKLLGRDRLILISDAIPCAGLPEGKYMFDGNETIIKDGVCSLPDGTLNGNINSLFECVKRAIGFGIPFSDAIYSASYMPAKKLGIENKKGSISEGKDADLVIIDDLFHIEYVVKNGIVRFGKDKK